MLTRLRCPACVIWFVAVAAAKARGIIYAVCVFVYVGHESVNRTVMGGSLIILYTINREV